MAKRSTRIKGLLPRLVQGLRATLRWAVRHPQPAVILVMLCGVAGGLWSYVQRADAFRITQVQLPASSSLKLSDPLVGDNLWTLDIRAVAEHLSRQHPWLRQVRVIRQPPNTIRIETIPRLAVAQVHVRQWHPVDADGFLLPQASASPLDRLPRLAGLDQGNGSLKVGAINTDERLKTALRVLKMLQRAPALMSRRVTELNVADVQQLRFVIDGEIEIRCGSEAEVPRQLERLLAVLKRVAKQSVAVRYIDVRFREPVIGPRT